MALIYACHEQAPQTSNSRVAFGQRHDALATDGDTGSTFGAHVFTLVVATPSAPSHRIVCHHSVSLRKYRGVSASDSMSYSRCHSLNSVAAMVVTAIRVTASNVIEMIGTEAGLSIDESAVVWPTSFFI